MPNKYSELIGDMARQLDEDSDLDRIQGVIKYKDKRIAELEQSNEALRAQVQTLSRQRDEARADRKILTRDLLREKSKASLQDAANAHHLLFE